MRKFHRLSETINKKQEKRVVSVTVKPILKDISGIIWLSDIQLQEGDSLTGFIPNTETMLQKLREGGEIKAPVWYNGIVRSKETIILLNLGKSSAGVDVHLYPNLDMTKGSVTLSQSAGGQRAYFPDKLPADNEIVLSATVRRCTSNGQPMTKEGFYQYSAAWDSKHIVELEQGKSARLLFGMQEMEDGGDFF